MKTPTLTAIAITLAISLLTRGVDEFATDELFGIPQLNRA
jgi:hypothetical protein